MSRKIRTFIRVDSKSSKTKEFFRAIRKAVHLNMVKMVEKKSANL